MHLIMNNSEVIAVAPDMKLATQTEQEITQKRRAAGLHANITIAYLSDAVAQSYLLDKGRKEWAANH